MNTHLNRIYTWLALTLLLPACVISLITVAVLTQKQLPGDATSLPSVSCPDLQGIPVSTRTALQLDHTDPEFARAFAPYAPIVPCNDYKSGLTHLGQAALDRR